MVTRSPIMGLKHSRNFRELIFIVAVYLSFHVFRRHLAGMVIPLSQISFSPGLARKLPPPRGVVRAA